MPTKILFSDGSSIVVDESPEDVRQKLLGNESGFVGLGPVSEEIEADFQHHIATAHVVRLQWAKERTSGPGSFLR